MLLFAALLVWAVSASSVPQHTTVLQWVYESDLLSCDTCGRGSIAPSFICSNDTSTQLPPSKQKKKMMKSYLFQVECVQTHLPSQKLIFLTEW